MPKSLPEKGSQPSSKKTPTKKNPQKAKPKGILKPSKAPPTQLRASRKVGPAPPKKKTPTPSERSRPKDPPRKKSKDGKKGPKNKKEEDPKKVPSSTFRKWDSLQNAHLPQTLGIKIDPGTLTLIMYLMSLWEEIEKERKEQHKDLNEIIPSQEFYEKCRDDIRRQPIWLSRKRRLKRVLAGNPSATMKEPQEDGCFRGFYLHLMYYFNELYWLMRDFLEVISIWKLTIQRIDAKFGLAVSNYFGWLRATLFLNLLYLCCALPLTVLHPRVLKEEGESKNETGAGERSPGFSPKDILSGSGYIGYSPMYLANYKVYRGSESAPFDSLAFCFIFLLILIFIVDSVLIWLRLVEFYRYHHWDIHNPGVRYKQFFIEIINMWRFRISRKKWAAARQEHIIRDLQMIFTNVFHDFLAYADHWAGRGLLRDKLNCHPRGISRNAINLLVTAAFGLAGLVIAIGLNEVLKSTIAQSYTTLVPALYVGLFSAIFPPFCVWITDAETWKSGETKMQHLIFRINIMYFFFALFINAYWLREAGRMRGWCWERTFGELIYKIVVIEFLCTLFATIIRYVFYTFFRVKPIFDGESLTCSLLFIHGIAVMGIFYAPLISVVVIVRVVLSFYLYWILLYLFCRETNYFYHQTEFITPYLILLIAYCLLTLFCNGYIVSLSTQSVVCGPFQIYNTSNSEAWDEVTEESSVRNLILKPGVLLFFIIIFGTMAKMLHSWSKGFHGSSVMLQDLLWSERSDREFLFEEIYNIVKKDQTEREVEERKKKQDQFNRLIGSMLKGSKSATDKLEVAAYKLKQVDKVKVQQVTGSKGRKDPGTEPFHSLVRNIGVGKEGETSRSNIRENERRLQQFLNVKVIIPPQYRKHRKYTSNSHQ